jgi:hypothetical protein
MSYAQSIVVVRKVKEYLETIVQNDVKQIYRTILITDEPLRLINQLREAKAYLSKMDHKEYNNVYIHLAPIINYSFRIDLSPTPRVVARLRVPKAVEEEVPLFHPVESHENPEIVDALGAIGYAISHKNIEELIFPALHMTAGEITPLHRWCEKNNYSIILSESGVIIRKK